MFRSGLAQGAEANGRLASKGRAPWPGRRAAPPFIAAMLAFFAPFAHSAGGFYFGAEAGAAMAQKLQSTRVNTGVPTNCDQWLDSAVLNDGTAVPLPPSQCQPRVLPSSPNDFDLDAGWLAGVQVGYALDRVRFEAEYFHRRQGGETLPLVVPGDDKQQEFIQRNEEIDDLGAHNLFANLYYGFGNGNSRFTPYVGVGVGAMRVKLDYSATSIRNSDRDALLALGRNPNAAGTTSRADKSLSDTLWGYQFMAGVDYALGPASALTVKFRYGDAFSDFKNDGNEWEPLRDHASTTGPGGAPILYGIEADDFGFWAVSVGFKFFLD